MGHNIKYIVFYVQVPYALAVRTPVFLPGSLGSTPGMGIVSCLSVNILYAAMHY